MRGREGEPRQQGRDADRHEGGAAQGQRTEFAQNRPARAPRQHHDVPFGLPEHLDGGDADGDRVALEPLCVLARDASDAPRHRRRHGLVLRAGDRAFDGHEEHGQRHPLMQSEHLAHVDGGIELEGLGEVTRDGPGQLLCGDPRAQSRGPRQRGDDDAHLDDEAGGQQAEARQRDAPVEGSQPGPRPAHAVPTSRNL